MVHLANQIICVCAWLTNFQPVLIAPTPHLLEAQVEEYFQALDDTESETERNDTLNI